MQNMMTMLGGVDDTLSGRIKRWKTLSETEQLASKESISEFSTEALNGNGFSTNRQRGKGRVIASQSRSS